jgi:phage terminase large subunit
MIKHTRLLNENEKAFNEGMKIVIHRGGTGSSKNFSNLQYILNLAWHMPGKVFSITSESIPHLDRGAIKDAKEILKSQGQVIKFNETQRFFSYPNGAKVEFFSADRVDIAFGPRRFFLYGNEINSMKFEFWDEAARRSKYVLGDFNPVTEFWLEKWLSYQVDYKIIRSNYLDNPHLPNNERAKIEKRCEMDPNFKRIHVDCEYGNAEDLVFLPENIIPIDEFPKDLKHYYGLDFGFVAPAALTKVGLTDDAVYIDEIFYRSGMHQGDYENEMTAIDRRDKITADSEDQSTINYLQQQGYNIFSAKKVAGSVDFGISFLQGKKLYITKRSTNTLSEFRNLMHAKDRLGKATGKYAGEDHAVDATRYAIEDETTGQNKKIGGFHF